MTNSKIYTSQILSPPLLFLAVEPEGVVRHLDIVSPRGRQPCQYQPPPLPHQPPAEGGKPRYDFASFALIHRKKSSKIKPKSDCIRHFLNPRSFVCPVVVVVQGQEDKNSKEGRKETEEKSTFLRMP